MVTALIAILISIAIGSAAYYVTRQLKTELQISLRELILGTIISVTVLLLFSPLTERLIINNRTKYYEFWNGYETAAIDSQTKCERDGQCTYTYNCDAYWATETYYTYDEDGNSESHTRIVRKYHKCPHVQVEHRYSIQTTLGTTKIDGTYADQDRKPWRNGESDVHAVPLGAPEFWKQAKARIEAGRNGGVTEVHTYKNFLLASDQTILKSYSDDVEYYKSKNLLPDHTRNYKDPIYLYYLADKFRPVQLAVNTVEWNEYLNRLNGYLGKELQGDVHMVAVNAETIDSRDRYSQSVFAYWKSDAFGKRALSKNTIGIVVGVESGIVKWARATSGMPVGNEALLLDIQNQLVDNEFNPDKVIGIPRGTGKQFSPGDGTLAQVLWGKNKFVRPCMECIEENQDGYRYLRVDISISGSQRFWIIFFGTIISIVIWSIFLYVDDRYMRSKQTW